MVARRRAARLLLAAQLGEPGRDRFVVRGELKMTAIVTERGRAIDHAIATRPDAAALKSRIQRERACDDLVLAGGVKAPDYAAHLLQIASQMRVSRLLAHTAGAMARP